MVVVISIRTLVRVVLCAVLLTTLAMVSWLANTGTSNSDEGPAQQTESVVVEAGPEWAR